MNIVPIESAIREILNSEWLEDKIEKIDKEIMLVLNKVKKKIEGPRRNVPFSLVKVARKAEIKYWKLAIQKEKGRVVDKHKLKNLERYVERDFNESIEKMNVKLEKAKEKFQEIIKKEERYKRRRY